jgi:hypothetical protein
VTSKQCVKGCRDPKAKDGLMWHESVNECPFEDYNPKVFAGRPGKMRAKGHPGVQAAQPSAAPKAAPIGLSVRRESITFNDSPASVTKGQAKPVEVVVVDYIVDAPHTKGFCNFAFRVVYFFHVQLDEIAFDWHKHLPKEQFQLTPNAEMSIDMTPRNFYSRGVTWVTKNLFQCKNLESAHNAIDSILFFEAFGGIGVALIMHYREVYKNSPKLKKKREEKARLKAQRSGAINTAQVGVTSDGVPVFTSVTSGGA